MSLSRQNQRAAYDAILERLPKKRKRIFDLFVKNPGTKEMPGITNQELSDKYQIPINEVSGRSNELKGSFFIEEAGSRENPVTGKKNTAYRKVNGVLRRNKLITEEKERLTGRYSILHSDYQNAFLSHSGRYVIEKELLKVNKLIKELSKILNTLNIN